MHSLVHLGIDGLRTLSYLLSASQRKIEASNMACFEMYLLGSSTTNFRVDHNGVISWDEVIKVVFALLIRQGGNILMGGAVACYQHCGICYGLTLWGCHPAFNSPFVPRTVLRLRIHASRPPCSPLVRDNLQGT